MTTSKPSFFRRIPLAISAFFRILFNAEFGGRVLDLNSAVLQAAPVAPVVEPVKPVTTVLKEVSPDAALQLLGLLQRDARLIDFTQENLAQYSDADIGAAARLVHEGCRKVLNEHFTIVPVRDEAEGARVTLPAGFDATSVRLTGNVVGQPPFNGTLNHRGWRASDVRLPKLTEGHNATVLAPAEVEL